MSGFEFMTELGKQTYEKVNNFGLGTYYDPYSGHIIISREDLTVDLMILVHAFLLNNREWCMGYEEDFLYVSPIEDLN